MSSEQEKRAIAKKYFNKDPSTDLFEDKTEDSFSKRKLGMVQK